MEPKQETMGDVFKYLPSNTLQTKEEKKKGVKRGGVLITFHRK